MDFEELTEEQNANARKFSSADDLTAPTEVEGAELSDEQLEALSGGVTPGIPIIIHEV